jgi:uncharacterized protein YktA (UPF0223 family)
MTEKKNMQHDRYYDAIYVVRNELDRHDIIVKESMSTILDSINLLHDSLEELKKIMSEYKEWKTIFEDSLPVPQRAKNWTTYERLKDIVHAKEEIEKVNLDYGRENAEEYLESTSFDLEYALDTAENLELPTR